MTIRVHSLEEDDRWAMVRRLVTDDGKPVEGFGIPGARRRPDAVAVG